MQTNVRKVGKAAQRAKQKRIVSHSLKNTICIDPSQGLELFIFRITKISLRSSRAFFELGVHGVCRDLPIKTETGNPDGLKGHSPS